MKLKDYLPFIVLNFSDYKEVQKELKLLFHSESLDRDQLVELQLQKLKILMNAARETTAYWPKVIKSDSFLRASSSQEILNELPELTKAVIRSEGEGIWSGTIAQYIVATTGGTTGHPLTVRRDLACNAITKAALWRGRAWWGIAPSTKTLYLNSFGKGTFKGRLRLAMANKRLGEAFPSSEEAVQAISTQIAAFRPSAIEGFATGLLESVNRATETDRIKVPVIVSTGEMIYPHQRKALADHYMASVYTYYGSNEIGSIAFECEHHQLHICEEHVIVETVNERGESVLNEPGKVLVTDLDNYAMPFIRYELGDIAVISDKPCACGRSSHVISELLGRSQDFLSGSEGRRLQATQLAGYLKDLTKTGQLQFIQGNTGEIEVLYDGDETEAQQDLQLVTSHLEERLGKDVRVRLTKVQEIEKTNRGKQPLVVRPKPANPS